MSFDDLGSVVRWRNEPQVANWFPNPPADVAAARVVYDGRISGRSDVRLWVAEWSGEPIGYLQSFEVRTNSDLAVRCQDLDAVVFDFLIGEPDYLGRGLGVEMVARFCRDVLFVEYRAAPRFLAAPDVRNHRSIHTLEKCGFVQGLWIEPEGAAGVDVVCTASRDLFSDS